MSTSAEHTNQGPITEKTKAILVAVERCEKKIDTILQNKNEWRAALMRALKHFVALIEK